jgi:hypothetical protein
LWLDRREKDPSSGLCFSYSCSGNRNSVFSDIVIAEVITATYSDPFNHLHVREVVELEPAVVQRVSVNGNVPVSLVRECFEYQAVALEDIRDPPDAIVRLRRFLVMILVAAAVATEFPVAATGTGSSAPSALPVQRFFGFWFVIVHDFGFE